MSYNPFSNGVFNNTPPTLSDGQAAPLQLDDNGNLKIVNVGGDTTDVEQWAGTDLGVPTSYGTPPSVTSPTPAFVQVGTAQVFPAATSNTSGFTNPTPANDVILVVFAWDGNDSNTLPTHVSDNLNGPYVHIADFLTTTGSPGGSLTSIAVYGVVASTTGTPVITVQSSSGQRGGWIPIQYTNVSIVLDQTSSIGQTTASTTITAPSVTTTQATELLIAITGIISNSTTIAPGSGYTIRYQNNSLAGQLPAIAIEDKSVASTGSYVGDFSNISASQFSSALLITLKGLVPNTNSIPVNAFVTNTVTVTGTVAATNPSVSATGAAVPADATMVGGSDGTNLRALATDASGNLKILAQAGTAIIGKVGIDQTTPGTTNGVQVVAALPAGTNVIGHVINDAGTAIIGKVGIDQTTPGTTNGVQVNAALPAGTNLIGKVGIDQTTPGTTNAVQDASDGPVTAGTAAGKSSLGALVAATAAPSPTAGQQIALQGDTTGNLRVSPFGATGSFHTQLATGTGSAPPSLTVPAGSKWELYAVLVTVVANSNTGRQILLTAANSGGAAVANALGPTSGATGSNPTLNNNFGPGLTATSSYTFIGVTGFAYTPFPSLVLGPSSSLALFINGGAAGDTVQLVANYIQVPD